MEPSQFSTTTDSKGDQRAFERRENDICIKYRDITNGFRDYELSNAPYSFSASIVVENGPTVAVSSFSITQEHPKLIQIH